VPNGLVLIPSELETGLAEAIIKDIICNRWEINPEYEDVLS